MADETTTFAPVAPTTPASFGAVSPTPPEPKPLLDPFFVAKEQPEKVDLVHGFLPPDAKKPKAPVEDPPDTKEQHFEAIRYLIDQLKTTTDAPTKATLENICTRLDEIEDKKTEKTVKW